MPQEILRYDDSTLIITGQIVQNNNRLSLRFTSHPVVGSEQQYVQFIPLEFLINFDRYMFSTVFSTVFKK